MKKILAWLLLLSMVLATLSSCTNFRMEKHPESHPMTKWEGDGFELYITGEKYDLLVVTQGEEQWFFKIAWRVHWMELMDTRPKHVTANAQAVADSMISWNPGEVTLATYNVYVQHNGVCRLEYSRTENLYGDLFPETVKLRKTAENLTPEDFPKIPDKSNDNYHFCPIYYYDTTWISHDGKMRISTDADESPIFATFEGKPLHIDFVEVGSMLYASKIEDDYSWWPRFGPQEQWQCEYFEDYFVATVIKSDEYEKGEKIIFRKQASSTESENNQGGT